ncbi:MAG TPA: DUF4340 domain-containing protein [Candidatus Binatia bacterium]|nr:DUF4340 domain-containing protein [Candidatus Binatia bacterium]
MSASSTSPGVDLAAPAGDAAVAWRRLAVLGIVVAALAAVAAWTVPARLAPPPTTPATPLLAIDPSAVREVDVRRGDVAGRLRRTPAGWSLALGSGERQVDADVVESFLGVLRTTARLTHFVESDLAAFGLDPPRGEVVLRDRGETHLSLGDRNPALTALYVRIAPSPDVVLAGSIVHWEFDRLADMVAREADGAG